MIRAYRYSLAITSQFFFCGVPLRLDASPKCTLNCLYCFAMSRGGRRTSNKQIADASYVSEKLRRVSHDQDAELDVNGEMLEHHVPVHFGGISDPFSNRLTSRVSREMLGILNMYDYPIVISTKNTSELVKDETLELLNKKENLVVQVSITTANQNLAQIIEPNSPTPEERIKDLGMLSGLGIYTIVRLQPLFMPWLDEIIKDLIPMLASAGCKHVIVEFLKLPVEENLSQIARMFKAISWNGYEQYRELGASLVGREWILPNQVRWEIIQPLIDSIHRCGMSFGSGDYGLNHMGDTDCCCGIDRLKGFDNWFKGNFSNVIRKSRSECLTFQQVADQWLPRKSIKMYMNSHSRLPGNNQVLDYLRDKWNRPGTANAPDAFLGVSYHGDRDENGDCIYVTEKILCR